MDTELENKSEGNDDHAPEKQMKKMESSPSADALDSSDGNPKTMNRSSEESVKSRRNHNIRTCDICGKSFPSGKALGGHRRSHFTAPKATGVFTKKNNKVKSKNYMISSNNELMLNPNYETHTCYLCKKEFRSNKSLFGHMRSHPERDYRGMQPPLINCTAGSSSSSNVLVQKADHDGYRDHHDNSSVMIKSEASSSSSDLLKSLSSWSKTNKRGRNCVGVVAAAHSLLLLGASGHASILNSKESASEPEKERIDDKSSSDDHEKQYSINDVKIDQKPKLLKLRIKNAGPLAAVDHNDGKVESADRVKNIQMKKKMKTDNLKSKFMKSDLCKEILDGEIDRKNVAAAANSYECLICRKLFSTYQALGGHRSSHCKQYGNNNHSINAKEECKNQKLQVKPEIEASGSHGMREINNQGGPRILNFDLNEPYVMENDDQEGFR